MRQTQIFLAAIGLLLVAGCRATENEPHPAGPLETPWSFDASADGLRSASCPAGTSEPYAYQPALRAEPTALGDPEAVAEALTGIDFVGGWSLTADLASFGGLSGLAVLPGGDLLSVSDSGAFVRIGFDQQAMAPTGTSSLSYLLDEAGTQLQGKEDGDAEGLAYRDGLALVSFERNHRVLAYDYGHCDGAARGIPVAAFGSEPPSLGHRVSDNGGAEALVLEGDTLKLGLETTVDRLGPTAVIDSEGVPQFAASAWLDGNGMPLVGLDWADGALFHLHRAYNPITGNTLLVYRTDEAGSVRLARLDRGVDVDNFEGIAVLPLADGRVRIFLISDNNFSDRQRTLLYVFETR